MLIRFQVANFLSFKDEVEFSMVAGKTQQHPNHIQRGKGRYDIDLLKSAVIYGANASGKSNLINAIHFAKNLILNGTKAKAKIPRRHFKLDRVCAEKPSKFQFEFKQEGRSYIYGFEVDDDQVQAEWLYELKATTEKMLFERKTSTDGNTTVEFGIFTKRTSQKSRDFLRFVAMGTRPNQLFLTESLERHVGEFEAAYRWFQNSLVVIFPDSKFIRLGWTVEHGDQLSEMMAKMLEQFGTGVCGFSLQEAGSELPEIFLDGIRSQADADKSFFVQGSDNSRYFINLDENKDIKVTKLLLRHRVEGSSDEHLFEMEEESDGTLRLLDLIPILYPPEDSGGRVYMIDELDRSLHPSLSYKMIELFLQDERSNSQLIVTTHEAGLLDFDLLRRDEIWFVEKDQRGASNVYSLEEFTPRYDQDIRKGYLLGRFGAIPMVGHVSFGCGEEEHA